MHKRILLLGADISDNSLGRVWILADMLSRYAGVSIAGLRSGAGIWPPLAGNGAHPIHAIPASGFPNIVGSFRLWRYVWSSDADILYICKPKFPVMVAALLARRGRELVLDNDDWEAGCARGGFSRKAWVNWLAARGISFTHIADWMIPLVKRRTVSNVFLQQRYGGVVIAHARDAAYFKDLVTMRAQFGLPADKRIVMFFGTPHKHKGVDALMDAMALAKDKNLWLVVAGLTEDMAEYASYKRSAEALLPGRYLFLAHVPWAQAPALLACADILAVPQRETLFTRWGQTPAKVFDAMAAGKPLIVSNIADIADIVGECAWLVAPDSAREIAAALDMICADPAAAEARAECLRERFLARYSYDHVAPLLAKAVLPD